jgi:hypothetical protein
MRTINLKSVLFSALVFFGLSSCERTKTTETTTTTTNSDTTTVAHRQTSVSTKADNDVRDFKNWVNEKTTRADSNAKEKWPEIKQDFKTRSAQLESKMDSVSAETKRDYEEAKARYQAWENRRDNRTSKPLDNAKLSTWRKNLLSNYSDINTVTAANAKVAYLLFMGVVRAKHETWSQEDWDYVDAVYGELNQRKREIENNISNADGFKIKTLQGEYLTLETAADVKDAAKDDKK